MITDGSMVCGRCKFILEYCKCVEESGNQRFGLLVSPPKHICQTPNLFWHWFLRVSPRIKIDDLFRCPTCFKVWQVPINQWTEAGGKE
jgi:hypothetical protein